MSQQEISRREAHVEDDPRLLSPPIVVDPLYACATAVQVVSCAEQAKVEVEVNGAIVNSATVLTVLPYGIPIDVPKLNPNDQVRARQTTSQGQSDWSMPPVTVRSHTVDFPAGPPRPEVFPLPLHKCGVRTGVRNLLIGGNVWVKQDGVEVGRENGCGNPQGVNVAPPFGDTRKVRAWFELCGDPSPPSIEHTTASPPAPLPTPIVKPGYGGGTHLDISGISNGAKVTVKRGGAVVLGTWACWGETLQLGGFPKFADFELIEAFQTMCPGDPPSPTGSDRVKPCSNLPAPQVGPIQGGDTTVVFTQYEAGAMLKVWLNGAPVGNGPGPIVVLSKKIMFGDTVIVAQDLPGCKGQKALRISVPCVDPPVWGDPSALNLFPVSHIDFANGANKGLVYYPAEDDGTSKAFNTRLGALGRVPLVVMAHGNHDASLPNHLGYEYFQKDLAKIGFVAVSVNCNALNGNNYGPDIIEKRADLIIGAIAVLQQLDADPGSVLFGHIDFSRVGLMGHSQGGDAVVLVPQVINRPGVNIRCVLALAPTDFGVVKRPLTNFAFLTILPASDGDVATNDGAVFYDQAQPSPFKSQLYVHFSNHEYYNRVWLDDDSTWIKAAPTPPVMSRHDHERVLSAYGCAFYRAVLLNHATVPYLSGKLLPASVMTKNVHLSFQQADALTVDSHQDGNGIVKNSLNASTQQQGGLSADEFQFHQGVGTYNSSFFGETIGMVARAGGNGRVFVQDLAGKRNLANHEIWIRVAEVHEGRPDDAPPTGFQLGLRDSNGAEFWIDSDDVGGLPRPFPRNPTFKKTMLKTLRFKTGCFAGNRKVDVTSVTTVLVRFNRNDERALALDDLQIVAS